MSRLLKRQAAAQAALAKYTFLSLDKDDCNKATQDVEAVEEAVEVKAVDEIQVASTAQNLI